MLIARTDESISLRILPHAGKGKFALLTPSEIDAEGMRGYYITLQTEWRSPDEADVTIYVGPAGPGIKMCCFTVVKRYQRVDGNWQFVRRISYGEH